MKNKLLLAVLAIMMLASCTGSKIGQWSEADKKTFNTDMNQVNLSAFGPKKQLWLDLYYKKLEANYDSYDKANQDESGCEKLALECNSEVFANGSVKGKWSQVDKDAFMKDMTAIDLAAFGEQKDAWIQCYFEKLQSGFNSYYEANRDETGCKKVADACSKEYLEN